MAVTIAGSGSVVCGVGYAETTTKTSTASLIPPDNTIPQVSEGAEMLSLSYTPKLSTSFLYVTVSACVNNAGNVPITVAVFRDGAANAVACQTSTSYGRSGTICYTFRISANSTAATTLSVRYGSSTGTSYLNQTDTSTYAGGVVSSIMVKEVNGP
jgi:hypothetical protein